MKELTLDFLSVIKKGMEFAHKISVIGAAGKMGSGISLILLQEIASSLAQDTQNPHTLILVDSTSAGFDPLKKYLREHLKKYAEKSINLLRIWYADRADLIDNADMVDAFVEEGLNCVNFASSYEECRGSQLVFEAIIENVGVKVAAYRQLNAILGPETFYFTNTSSIPIKELQENSGLVGRLIGCHFYNPPAVQKLLEIIIPKGTDSQLQTLAYSIAKRLNKIVVRSNDVAGFIGNGHFIREIQFACAKVEELMENMSFPEAIYTVNLVTQDVLVRPMGIFQLIDYVGIDVCASIAEIMTRYLHGEDLRCRLIKEMLQLKIQGGQHPNGSQKDGFFHYEGGVPKSVFDKKQKVYLSFTADKWKSLEKEVGVGQHPKISWKTLSKDPQREHELKDYFEKLWQVRTLASKLAEEILLNSHAIAYRLVHEEVAHSIDDVNAVLEYGFFHLYSVDLPFSMNSAHKKMARG